MTSPRSSSSTTCSIRNTHPHRSLRAVFDSNVLISSLHFPGGTLSGVWQPLQEGRYSLILSPSIVVEMAERLRVKFGWEEGVLQRTLRAIVRKAVIVQPMALPEIIPGDPDDDHILACALADRADLIVTGDRDILRLKAYQGVPIVRPMDFLRMVGDARAEHARFPKGNRREGMIGWCGREGP